MIEKAVRYPAYEPSDPSVLPRKAMLSLSYEQILEVANVFFFVNKHLAGKIFGGIRLSEKQRVLHKAVHDAAVNCCISLEEYNRIEKEGSSKS